MKTEIEFSSTSCAVCGLVFALPADFHTSLKQTGQGFYCPNGHCLSFGGGENEKLKGKLERTENQLNKKNEIITNQEKEISNKKGQLTKLKKKLEVTTTE